jgi:hypothetical protein
LDADAVALVLKHAEPSRYYAALTLIVATGLRTGLEAPTPPQGPWTAHHSPIHLGKLRILVFCCRRRRIWP